MKPLTLAEFKKAAKAGSAPDDGSTIVRAEYTLKASPKDGDESNRVLNFVASDETLDRYGDVVSADGWKLDNFRKNPVILWMHNNQLMTVGKCIEIGVKDGALVGAVEFAPPDVNPFAEQVYQAYRKGFLSAVSVGFWTLKWEWMDSKDPENFGIRFLEHELWEFSAVTIPANPNALIIGERSAPPVKHVPPSVAREYVKTRKECVS